MSSKKIPSCNQLSLLGAVLTETCVFETRFMRHYNVCSKMMEKGRKMWDVSCFFPSPSFYYIHCSDAWNAFQTHTFRSRRPLTTYFGDAKFLQVHFDKLHFSISEGSGWENIFLKGMQIPWDFGNARFSHTKLLNIGSLHLVSAKLPSGVNLQLKRERIVSNIYYGKVSWPSVAFF